MERRAGAGRDEALSRFQSLVHLSLSLSGVFFPSAALPPFAWTFLRLSFVSILNLYPFVASNPPFTSVFLCVEI